MNTNDLLAYRQKADDFFKSDPRSPLTPDQRATFAGLHWFPPNPAFDLVLQAHEFDDKRPVVLPRTSPKKPPNEYVQWGELTFDVSGKTVSLLLLYSPEHDVYFLGFWDATSGHESYGGGRYLEPEPLGDGRFHIDFNRAYNPYCAYNDNWSCTIPPAQNRLPVRIEAGQKAFRAPDSA